MILVRDVFRIKFGKMREALAVWKQIEPMFDSAAKAVKHRLLTDLVGPYYTLVLEMTFESLAEWENFGKTSMTDEWRKKYQEAVALTESGYREIFNIVN
jgi:hypothetical protein